MDYYLRTKRRRRFPINQSVRAENHCLLNCFSRNRFTGGTKWSASFIKHMLNGNEQTYANTKRGDRMSRRSSPSKHDMI